MAPERLSALQRRILTWLLAEDQRTRGTMAADHRDLVRALVALGFDKGNISTSLQGLERKGLIRLQRTPGGKAEAIDLGSRGRELAEVVNKKVTTGRTSLVVAMDDVTFTALHARAGREGLTDAQLMRRIVHQALARRTHGDVLQERS